MSEIKIQLKMSEQSYNNYNEYVHFLVGHREMLKSIHGMRARRGSKNCLMYYNTTTKNVSNGSFLFLKNYLYNNNKRTMVSVRLL